MSASNWAVCPKCTDKLLKEKRELKEHVADSYGKIPAETWLDLKAQSGKPITLDKTFREDYEIYGAENGNVEVSYSGECSVCGLNLDFKIEKPFYTITEDEE